MQNPFRIGERVAGEYFTDRAEEVGRIHRAMGDPSRLLVYGPRRMGKSSAIEVASERMVRDGGAVVRADLGGATGVVEVADRLLTSLARETSVGTAERVAEWVKALSLELTTDAGGLPVLRLKIRTPEGDRLPGLADVLDRLERMSAEGTAPVCVVLDEFQRLVEFGPKRAAWELRDIMQGHHHISYVCAGSEEGVIERLTASDGPFHGAFERLYMTEIPRPHFARWIDDRLRTSGISHTGGIGAAAIEAVGPRTEDVLKLARQLWFHGSASRTLTPGQVEVAMGHIVRGDRGIFETLWAELTPHQQNVLRAVAGRMEALTSDEARRRYDLKSGSAVSQAVGALIDRGLLARVEGKVVFDDPFFGAWIREVSPPGL